MKMLKNVVIPVAVAAYCLVASSVASAWWGGPGYGAWAWDPQEAYLYEYGFYSPYGPSPSDIRRMYRDNWLATMGVPVYRGTGPYGPTPSDIRAQQRRKYYRSLGYPY